MIASNAGNDRTPAWWLNLQANPTAQVLAGRRRYSVVAREASPEERPALRAEFATQNPGFDEYRHLTERDLPVVLLEPIPTGREQ